jgi:hypothetical protein
MRSGVVSAAKMSFFSDTFSRHNFSEAALGLAFTALSRIFFTSSTLAYAS